MIVIISNSIYCSYLDLSTYSRKIVLAKFFILFVCSFSPLIYLNCVNVICEGYDYQVNQLVWKCNWKLFIPGNWCLLFSIHVALITVWSKNLFFPRRIRLYVHEQFIGINVFLEIATLYKRSHCLFLSYGVLGCQHHGNLSKEL